MPSSPTAIWSAIAATAALGISLSIFWVQRRSLLESLRPELVLTDWGRRTEGAGEKASDVITFRTIRNVGRGAAFQIILNASRVSENRPVYVLSTTHLPILASKEDSEVNGEIRVWWKNVDLDATGSKHVTMVVEVLCWDSGGMRHQTEYLLMADPPERAVTLSNHLAPGVMLVNRRTMTRPVWWLKLTARRHRLIKKMQCLPGLARLWRKKEDASSQE